MNQISQARLKLLLIVLAVVACVHLAVLLPLGFVGCHRSAARSGETPVPEESGGASGGAEAPVAGPAPAPAATGRFRVPSSNPKFGAPLDFSRAVRGNLKELPGSQSATSGILVDLDTRRVLWEKNSDRSVPIASMVKMMTLLLTFEELESNPQLNLETPVRISQAAARIGGSQIWLDPRETFPLRELLLAVAIKSANDAAYQVAEFIAGGKVEEFVSAMNRRAAELGMPGTRFTTPHGLPLKEVADSVSTAQGMVLLGERLLEYPQLLEWTSTQLVYIRDGKTQLVNHNGLIRPRYPGVDGLKTGYTDRAGFCVTVSALREGKRLLLCVTGFKSAKERDAFARKLLDWGYTQAAQQG